MLLIGRRVIVSFPNFSHRRSRMQLFIKGYAPVTRQLPYMWYDTHNIRVITLKDFRQKEVAVNAGRRGQGAATAVYA